MRVLLTLLVASTCLCWWPACAGELQPEGNTRLVHLLNAGEIIAEVGHPDSVYAVRLVQVRENGECDGAPTTCPTTTLYVAVSETGLEYPEEVVFVFPPLNDYRFDGWVELPSSEGPNSHVKFRIITSETAPDPTTGRWVERKYEVNVNPFSGFVGVSQ